MADNARKTALTTTQKGDGGISPPVFNSTYGKTFGVWPRKERGPGFRRVPGTPGRTPFNGTAIEAPRTPRDDRLQVPAALFRDVHPPASRRWSSRLGKSATPLALEHGRKASRLPHRATEKQQTGSVGYPLGTPPPSQYSRATFDASQVEKDSRLQLLAATVGVAHTVAA